MCFLISFHLSLNNDILLFIISLGRMIVYALLIIGSFFFQKVKRKKQANTSDTPKDEFL